MPSAAPVRRRQAMNASSTRPVPSAAKLVCEYENQRPANITGTAAATARLRRRGAVSASTPIATSSASAAKRPKMLGSKNTELTRKKSVKAFT